MISKKVSISKHKYKIEISIDFWKDLEDKLMQAVFQIMNDRSLITLFISIKDAALSNIGFSFL